MNSRMDLPHVRLAAFIAWQKETSGKGSQATFGAEIGRTQAAISQILAGKKLPDRLTANAIERVTGATGWPGGAIRSEEWDAVETAREAGEPIALAPTGTDEG